MRIPTPASANMPFNSPKFPTNNLLNFDGLRSHTAPSSISEQLRQLSVYETELRGENRLTDANVRDVRQWLISSPYSGTVHQLDLLSLDLQNRLMALALQALSPASGNYATQPYPDAFKWIRVMEILRMLVKSSNMRWASREFYVVDFRSQLKEQIDRDLLWKLDEMSHAEAARSGGLLKYWYGNSDLEQRNLATCLWRSKEDAVKGGQGPWHKQARAIVPNMYEQISVKGFRLVIEDDVSGWRFEQSGRS
jgi:hypothetical protein